ncbi:betaine/proline/choline family ABC transporter ATP-binding protein [Psychrobacillus sp. NEAU-3TGS]|uniref:ABC transporter ATP-binding protein n=1 Tax=Psychrobacillus sp. NEAU-3TGS TaxID=2995412 RepID=UPI002498E6FD|nr:betaine/proline/choline family ABC transporter ATP-binding protein [Psychrobacillus sp. NEAU-3TGS]MDI2588351.1 betaine/proline/choline family ABC transporter ATP-binding protein [Psychrobacillus sp. NEAU-3TGS]
MIQFDKVTKVFGDGTEALKDVSLTIPTEELVVLIGPSGCGKTTLMKMINRLEIPTSGEVYVGGKDVSSVDAVELRKTIGYVIQRIGLFPHMSVERNASLVPNLKGWTKTKKTEQVYELMQMVGLDPKEYLSKYPLELSGGQQQRIGVVRALAGNPDIVLMDEPFSALDPISREQLQMEIKNIQKKLKKTIVFVTHDMDEALKIADTIVIMRNGQIEQTGTPTELIESPINQFVQDFIGIERINQKKSIGKRELQDLIPSFNRSEQSSYLIVEANILVEEAINLLENVGIESLLVKKGNKELGFVNQSTLLRAMLTKEEVS